MTFLPSTVPRPRSATLPRRSSTVRGGLGALAAALALALGCEQPTVKPALPRPPKGVTPEAKLERVIQRLEFALNAAQGSPDFGVASTRTCQHRLIPPSADEPRPTAEVTIETRRVVTAGNGAKSPSPAAPKGAAPDAAATAGGAPPRATNVEREKFLLVYDHDRWSLPEKPKSETLQICFDSALAEE